EVRRTVKDAGALVIATDHEDARGYATQLEAICGEKVTTILSDDPKASQKIDEFAASDSRWMVAVRMVSEGVDVPRLCVGVYATSTSTPLFFAQAVGRFVRSRKRGEVASVFLPSVPVLMALANEMEVERDHALDRAGDKLEDGLDDAFLEEANREEKASDELNKSKFEALNSQAAFDRVLFDGGEFGTGAELGSDEELGFLGIPGLLDTEQVSALLREQQNKQINRGATKPAPVSDHRRMMDLRSKLSKNVSAWASRTGMPHGQVHNKLRSVCGGPAVPQATVDQLQARIDKLQDWFVGRK
ncbi:MAG: DEAD/DEAH box helicase, partial [Glutamicibacter ardleyensis]